MGTVYGNEAGPGAKFRVVCQIKYTQNNTTGVFLQKRNYLEVTNGRDYNWATVTTTWSTKSYALSGNGIYADTGWKDVGWKDYGAKIPYDGSAQYTGGSGTTYKSTATGTYTVPMPSYRIVYSAEGGTGAPEEQIKSYGEALKLSAKQPTRTGYLFEGWKATDGTTYQPGADYTKDAPTTLRAIWKAKSLKIIYHKNDGSETTKTEIITYGVQGNKLASEYTREGYKQTAWTTDAGKRFAVDAAVPDPWIDSQYPQINLWAEWTMTANAYIKVSGTYRPAMVYRKQNGSYKMTEPYVKNGTYKKTGI